MEDNHIHVQKKKIRYTGKAICAVKPDGSMAGWFESQKQLREYLGLKSISVSKPLRTGSFYYGFKWMLLEEYRDKWMNGEDMSYSIPEYLEVKNRVGGIKKGMGRAFWDSLPIEVRKESKRKCSLTMRDRICNGELKIKHRSVRCIETGDTFYSIADCARKYNVASTTIFYAIKNKTALKQSKHHFMYA